MPHTSPPRAAWRWASTAADFASEVAIVIAFAIIISGQTVAPAAGATLADGDIVGWGNNKVGQVNAPAGSFTAIAAGNNHSLGLRSDGTLVGWGDNSAGQVNVPAGTFTAIAADSKYSLALRSDGILIAWGSDPGDFEAPPQTFAAVAAGVDYSLGLRPNGTLVGWGSNTYGRTTVPAGTFLAVSAGDAHGLGIRSDRTLAAWGDNTHGQTTVPAGTFAAIAAGGLHSLGLRTDGTVTGWGTYYQGGPYNVPSGQFTTIAAGTVHSLGIRSDGTLAGWGSNFDGQSNVPAGVFTAIAGGGSHSLALRARTDYDGDLRIFGGGATARLNRSVNVAGDLIVETAVTRVNNAVAEVDGRLILRNSANLADGVYYVGGLQVDSAFTLPANVSIANSGPLTGSATLVLGSGSHLDIGLAPANAYSGALSLSSLATVTLNGTGSQNAFLLGLSDSSEFYMGGGQRMRLTNTSSGFALLNSGKVEILGSAQFGPGELDVLGRASNSGNALIIGRDAVMRFRGGLDSSAAFALTGGVNDISGDIANHSTGKIDIIGGAQATFYDDVLQNGALQVSRLGSASSLAVFLGDFRGSRGGGGGGDVYFQRKLSPGDGLGSITFDNNVSLGAGATLEIELGGAAPGSGHDQLRIIGALSLGGELHISLVNGFMPSSGQSFNILDWASLSGTFSAINLPALPGRAWNTSQLYASGVLSVTSSAANPDFDGNGLVGAGDLVRWKAGFGMPAGAALGNGDANADGDVDGGDFLAWQRRLGGAPAVAAAAVVPEPHSVLLWTTGAGLVFARLRRARRRFERLG